MDNKVQVALLVRALNRMRRQYQELCALCEEFDRHDDERLLQQWRRRWRQEQRGKRLLEART